MQYLKIISSLGKSALIYSFISLLFPVNFRGVSKGGGEGGSVDRGSAFCRSPNETSLNLYLPVVND